MTGSPFLESGLSSPDSVLAVPHPAWFGDETDLAVAEVNNMIQEAKRRLASEWPDWVPIEWRTA